MKSISEPQLVNALICQVTKAANGGSETDVTTFISKPLWKRFLKAIGINESSKPTGWNGDKTIRVYGSNTIVVESNELFSCSVKSH